MKQQTKGSFYLIHPLHGTISIYLSIYPYVWVRLR